MRSEQAAATANGIAKKQKIDKGQANGHMMTAKESEAMKESFEQHEPVGLPVYGEKKLDCSDAEWRARVDLAAGPAFDLCIIWQACLKTTPLHITIPSHAVLECKFADSNVG